MAPRCHQSHWFKHSNTDLMNVKTSDVMCQGYLLDTVNLKTKSSSGIKSSFQKLVCHPQFDTMELNYFTCTLGEAQKHNLTNAEFKNINSFLNYQSKYIPDHPAVGFYQPPPNRENGEWTSKILSFREVRNTSLMVAEKLQPHLNSKQGSTIALLCPSSPEFMFIWLSLIRLGFPVLLLAPQCQPDAIVHLCRECEAEILLFDKAYGGSASDVSSTLKCQDIADIIGTGVWNHVDGGDEVQLGELTRGKREPNSLDTAYIHHTSGTSSGLPKPIPQPHNAAVTALPSFKDGHTKATFTTTPLYHGGIADVFRSWTSGGLIWLYPGKEVPITGPNIVKALDAATHASKSGSVPPIAYISCVPYVLQLIEKEERGLEWLQKMDIVGIGGAALPEEVGNRIVESGVNLVSRFGSSECGFLMSSHRAYSTDKAWQYLRNSIGPEFVSFEESGDGLFELVVLSKWPHMAKRNRPDGSFATSDLFEPHPHILNAWRYHSRSDSQLTLITGKKFDPAPLEAALADSELLSDALIFGNGKPYPGVLLFRSSDHKNVSDEELQESIWPILEQLNSKTQDHARISASMMIPMPWQDIPLEKSSKGTLIRAKVEQRFADASENAYQQSNGETTKDIPDEELENIVLKAVQLSTGRSIGLDTNTDLFAYGVDSIACMQIRGRLQGLVGADQVLPATIVENCGSIHKVAQYIHQLRQGETVGQDDSNEHQLMLELVDEYSQFEDQNGHTNGHVDVKANGREVVVSETF